MLHIHMTWILATVSDFKGEKKSFDFIFKNICQICQNISTVFITKILKYVIYVNIMNIFHCTKKSFWTLVDIILYWKLEIPLIISKLEIY